MRDAYIGTEALGGLDYCAKTAYVSHRVFFRAGVQMTASRQPPPGAISSFPLVQSCLAAWVSVLSDLPVLIRMAAYPFALSAALTLASFSTVDQPLFNFVLSIAGYVPMVLFAVAWHRRTLHDKALADSTSLSAWTLRHWRFFTTTMSLILIAFGAGFLVSVLGSSVLPVRFALILSLLVALFLSLRFCFVWPAVAVEERDYSFKTSWEHTRGQGGRIFLAFLLINIPSLLLVFLAQFLLHSFILSVELPDTTSLGLDIATVSTLLHDNMPVFLGVNLGLSALSYLPVAANFALLSLIFRQTTGWVPAQSPKEAHTTENGGG